MDIQRLIDDYAEWLRKEITFEQIGEYYEITTPYLNNANDYLQIYVRQEANNIYFSDDGATINGLKMNGLNLTSNRKKHLQKIIYQYGLQLHDDELTAKTPISNFAQKKHSFIQAILHVDDMFVLSKSKVSSFFLDDVQEFFAQNDIFYSDNIKLIGKTGFTHHYDFLLQRNKKQPERLCRAVNAPSKDSMASILFAWDDTKSERKEDSQLIVILNDQKQAFPEIEEGFKTYNASVIRWSERKKPSNLSLLSA